jgi:hypothetical protein
MVIGVGIITTIGILLLILCSILYDDREKLRKTINK